MLTEEHIAKGIETPILGPAYFCSREVVERAMAGVQSSDFKPMVDGVVNTIADHIWEKVQDHLLSDTEMNLQGAMWTQVDDMVRHLLAGEEWAMKRFLLGERYNCDKIRRAVAKHVPKELQDTRIADLEAEVARLKNDLAFYRNR